MRKKRDLDENKKASSSPVEVIVEDVSSHPFCLHGPTLLFSGDNGRFFACSTCRNKRDCPLHINEEEWAKESVRKRNEKYHNLIPKLDKVAAWDRFNEVKSKAPSDRAFCNTCQELYLVAQSKKHGKDHKIFTPITNEQLSHPSTFLPRLEDDCKEAQYLFTKESIRTLFGILSNNKVSDLLCIGTPSVHEAAQSRNFRSMLLDFDARHHWFNPPNKFLWYNMFNNYLFDKDDVEMLKKYFSDSGDKICILIDPPFAGRVEPIVNTLKEISALYRRVCRRPDVELLPVIWAFPYFSASYIVHLAPEIRMHDYQVNYENHKKFQNGKGGRKFGSPVRFFTNLPLATIDLSNDTRYKYCDKCKHWVSIANRHCDKCGECTSKNGMTYVHCDVCGRCVKPTFFHCEECGRCCQETGHVCGVVVRSQSCYNCKGKGHKRSECPQLQDSGNKKKKIKQS